jgi:dolichol-phosphate mannosyltransferase
MPAVTDGGPRLSVVIPTRNEATTLPRLHAELTGVLAGVEHEVIVVDDSTDVETRQVLAELVGTSPNWRVIAREPAEQTGLATAVARGMDGARGAVICVMDSDLQHPPALIPELVGRIEAGADLAVASRYTPGGASAGLSSRYRKLASRGSTWVAHLLFPEARRTSDPLSGFFCLRRSAILGAELRPIGFKILLELLVLCPELTVTDVPFRFGERADGESKAGLRQGLLYLRHLTSLFFDVPLSARPLKFALVSAVSLAGFLLMFAGLSRSTLPVLAVWAASSLVSSVANAVLQRALTFQRSLREPSLYRALGAVGSIAGLLAYPVLLAATPDHPMVMATLAQTLALAAPLGVNFAAVRLRIRGWTTMTAEDLDQLGRRVRADVSCWVEVPPVEAPIGAVVVAGAVTPELVRRCSKERRAHLMVEPLSSRPPGRRHAAAVSAIVAPAAGATRVAVLVRLGRKPFDRRDLEEAVTWAHGQGRLDMDAASVRSVPEVAG